MCAFALMQTLSRNVVAQQLFFMQRSSILIMRIVVAIGLFVLTVVSAAVGFVYSGLYNVAAIKPHLPLVWWALHTTMENSVEHHASSITAPPLGDEGLVMRGIGQFHIVCAPCHGAPGVERAEIGIGVNPTPPDLSGSSARWNAAELFWIIKNGVKYAGMPAWGPSHRDDEIWALVAFILALPNITPERYAALTRTPIPDQLRGIAVAAQGGSDPAAAACIGCHGAGHNSRDRSQVPRLAGQQERYLVDSLRRYASGIRPSGIMGPISRALTGQEIDLVAGYFSKAAAPSSDAAATDLPTIQAGGAISAVGLPDRGIPACASCHGHAGHSSRPEVPILAGQNASYLALQLDLWRLGVRTEQPMRDIASRLSPREIADTAAYFAAVQPVATNP